ncbi:carbohydrate ABC transporter permease [Thermoflexus sp.]|uniref:carbohydrate ABC transporter permease n=1 Tax=Thermoflexus sp. TaxID=1969742 RepID=UPI0035E43695
MSWRWIGRMTVYLVLLTGSLVMLLPLVWMTSSAFKPLHEVMLIPPTWIPEEPTLDNFRAVFAQFPFGRYFLNSLITSSLVTLSVLLTSAMAGYALAKFHFPGRDLVFILVLSSLMVPFQTRMIPLYQLAISLRLQDTLLGVMFPWLVDAFGIFLMRQFMLTIPSDLIDAARIDGASEWRIFWTIMLPLVRPALAALAIFTFLGSWEEFLWPLIITSSDASRTIPVGLQFFSEQYGTNIHWQMAGALIAAMPMLIVFFLLQRQIIEGIALTGMRG